MSYTTKRDLTLSCPESTAISVSALACRESSGPVAACCPKAQGKPHGNRALCYSACRTMGFPATLKHAQGCGVALPACRRPHDGRSASGQSL